MFYYQPSKRINKRIFFTLILIFILFHFNSCSSANKLFGIILYPKGLNIKTEIHSGSIVKLFDQNENNYFFKYNGKKYLIPKPFMLTFESIENAQKFKEDFIIYQNAFAAVSVNGLKLRDTPAEYSRIIHRLEKNEIIKIINRSKKQGEADGEKDYWYLAVTQDGLRGYCFGYYLDVYESNSWSAPEIYNEKPESKKITNDFINKLLSTTWRPYYLYERLENGVIDFDLIQRDIGLTFDEKNKIIKIIMPNKTFETNYYNIKRSSYNTYSFWDSSVVVQNISEREIIVSYKIRDKLIKQRFVKLNVPLSQIIEKAHKLQTESLEMLLKKTKHYKSDVYGYLRIQDNGTFYWETTDILQSHIMHVPETMKGDITFIPTNSPEIKTNYDGSFVLHNIIKSPNIKIFFLYRLYEKGIQLRYIPEKCIENNKIQELPEIQIIMFFNFSEKQPE